MIALLTSKIGRWAAIIGGLMLALLTFGKVQKRKGAQQERAKQKEADHENADDIRKRADAVEPMHDDKLKFRD